jgi:hypothetical protein
VDPILGSLVYQLPKGVTLAYNLHLGHMIAHWKGIDEQIHFTGSINLLTIIEVPNREKRHLGPQNGPRSSGPKKLLKIVNCQQIVLSQLNRWVTTNIHLNHLKYYYITNLMIVEIQD